MNIQLNTVNLRPATMATIIADLMDMPGKDATTITQLVAAIDASVGEEETIEFLADAGVTPESLDHVFGLLHD